MCGLFSFRKRTAHYQYTPLQNREVRLLFLRPASSVEKAVFCSVRHVSLKNMPAYEALSYVWGDPEVVTPVTCKRGEINVTLNLHSALRHLRHKYKVRVLWVDAICIDQANLEERSQQVLLMADIYRQARGVLAWLGEETEDTKGSFQSIMTACTFFPPYPEVETDEAIMKQKILAHTYRLEDEGKPNLLEYDWIPMIRLFQRPWFTRKWVIQEVAHARELTLLLGRQSLAWDNLGGLMEAMLPIGLPPQFTDILPMTGFSLRFPPIDHVMHMMRLRTLVSQGDAKVPFLDLVIATRSFSCLDPKDQIIAIASLVKDAGDSSESITPNYTISTEAFFKQVASWSILREKNLRLLSIVSDNFESSLKNLPSWIPDFSLLGDRFPLSINDEVHFCACGKLSQTQATFSNDRSILHLSGVIADEIRTLGRWPLDITPECPTDDEAGPAFNKEAAWIRECKSLASNACFGSSIQEQEEAFCKTMLCDLTGQGGKPTDDYSTYFAEFLKLMESGSGGITDSDEEIKKNLQCSYIVEESLIKYAAGRRFCITAEGRMAQVPKAAEIGDLICVFEGGVVPFVLRRKGEDAFSLVGESYVHGIMDGEAITGKEDSLREFTLV